jgi:EAL domain-containing protein (putative c-di-GMP-specific phosphodiesterase class I)
MTMGVDYVQGYAIARPKPMTSEYFAPTQENQLPQWCGALAIG